jgi:hypothetical protein
MAALLLLLEQAGVGHYAPLLEKNGFTVDNISHLNERDCDKLRITNRSDRKALLNMKEFVARETARTRPLTARRPASARTRSQTASESCREATCFVDHVRIDKAWPQLGSLLASTVGISARPPNQPKPAFGRQSTHCTCCDELNNVGATTEWEYECVEVIAVGSIDSSVRVWRKFSSRQNKRIDRAWRSRHPQVSIDGFPLDFGSARWHGHRVRRFDPSSTGPNTPFPTLTKRETLEMPEMGQDKLEDLQDRLAGLHKQLLDECHAAGILKILGEEAVELMDIRAEIAADVANMFVSQQRALEQEETDRRRDLEKEYLNDMDALWNEAVRSAEQALLMAKVRDMLADADAIRASQCVVMEHMECVARKSIEEEEECERANLMKIAMKLNALASCRTPGAAHASITSAGDRFVACPICRKKDCPFFLKKWKGHWSRHAAEENPLPGLTPAPPTEEKLMRQLFTRVREAELKNSPRKTGEPSKRQLLLAAASTSRVAATS